MSEQQNLKIEIPQLTYNKDNPDPSLVLFYQQLSTRDFWLDTEINWDNCSFLIQYIQYLNKNEGDDLTPITLHIMSGGGELPTMFTLYDTLINSKIPIHTINEGGAHSAAFIIFLAGSKRTMREDALFVAHEGAIGLSGNYRESKAAMQNYEIDVERMKSIICSRTEIPESEVELRFSIESDWYIRKDDAKKFGIITE